MRKLSRVDQLFYKDKIWNYSILLHKFGKIVTKTVFFTIVNLTFKIVVAKKY